jgi:hypothetical protein
LQRLFSTLNRINRQDRRRLDMSSLEELTVVQRDAPERDVLKYFSAIRFLRSHSLFPVGFGCLFF